MGCQNQNVILEINIRVIRALFSEMDLIPAFATFFACIFYEQLEVGIVIGKRGPHNFGFLATCYLLSVLADLNLSGTQAWDIDSKMFTLFSFILEYRVRRFGDNKDFAPKFF